MRILKLNSLFGVKNQMYSQEQCVGSYQKTEIGNGFFDINSLFWSKIFSAENVRDILNLAARRLQGDPAPKIQAVLAAPEQFFDTYISALNALRVPVSAQSLFQSMETLEIICELHSKLFSMPYRLTLSQGYIHSKYSALDLANTCLLPSHNPYLAFIESEILPEIFSYKPEILVMAGKPNIASFAIAKRLRETDPNVFIVAADSESEYYSMRKIKGLLAKNDAFFSTYHCAVLGGSRKALAEIERCLTGDKEDLKSVSNLIFSWDGGKTIYQTEDERGGGTADLFPDEVAEGTVLNLRAFPLNHCYWNKCAFCGINSKYGNQANQGWDIDLLVSRLRKAHSIGIHKFWLLDEAIPVSVLQRLCKQLIAENLQIEWHVRTRIEPEFTDDSFGRLLWRSGVRHMIFGLESASDRILKMTGKTSGTFDYLEVAEKTIKNLTVIGIAVHFSVIIGFPSESEREIENTAAFLRYLFATYKRFSYNINTFYLDIGSEMYRRWESFDISQLCYPCAPKHFLENHLDWNSAISSYNALYLQQMRERLTAEQYPWYPKGALVSPSVFFSFWEYSRYCFQNVLSSQGTCGSEFNMNQSARLSPSVILSETAEHGWLMYHLQNHHYLVGGSILTEIKAACEAEQSFCRIIERYSAPYKEKIQELIKKLARMDFFEII